MTSPTPTHPPVPVTNAHAEFMQTQLPTWLTQAPQDVLSALRNSLSKGNQARHEVREILDRLQSPEAFTLPLLKRALQREYLTLLDATTSILVREWKNYHLFGLLQTHARTTEHSLLEAALQNFEAEEAEPDGMEEGSGLFTVSADGRLPSALLPTAFAGFCRTLDLGGSYLTHVRTVTHADALARTKFREHAQYRFETAVHFAYLKGELTPRAYEEMFALASRGHHSDLTCSHLTLDGVALAQVMVIHDAKAPTQPTLYIPEDPLAPLRQYASMQDLQTQLAIRLEQADYLAFFKRLVPVHQQQTLLGVRPAWINSLPIGSPGKIMPASLEKTVTLTAINGSLFQSMARQLLAHIEADACAVAVPTAQADIISRQKRLQFYKDLGKSLLFFAASFVPVVGEVLLVVCGAQLIHTVYNGFAAWSRGDSQEALEDLLDVVDNVATAVATAGAIKATRFTAGLIKVQVRNQGWRLWHHDLQPYRQPLSLPDHLIADKSGLYRHEQQHFLKLDDHVHAVQRSPDGKQWEVQHPSDPQAYSPPLLSNGVGGWRQLHETPKDWDSLKLIKRLGPEAANITQPCVEPILLVSGVDDATLREAHQEMVPPPPLLRDTVRHFNLEQEINDFDLDRAEGKTVTAHSPHLQFHLLASLPDWPATHTLKIVDAQQRTLMSIGSGPLDIKVNDAGFRRGELLHRVQEQLPQTAFNKLLPASSMDYLTKTENLAIALKEQAVQNKQWLFSQLEAASDQAQTPVEEHLRKLVPQLSRNHLQALDQTLAPQERKQLLQAQSLTPTLRAEAEHYRETLQAAHIKEGLFLGSVADEQSLPMRLYAMEQIPGWPQSLNLKVHAGQPDGPLLASIGHADAPVSEVLIRQGERYVNHVPKALESNAPSDLTGAIERTLSTTERSDIARQTGTETLEQALHKTAVTLLGAPPPPCRTMPTPWPLPHDAGLPLDPLFADQTPPACLTLRADNTHQSPPLPDGSYRYYIRDNQKYYQVRFDPLGWRLVDTRSRFRAYQPYVRQTSAGGWEIDPAKGALLGGRESPTPSLQGMEATDEFESAHSATESEYESAEEGRVSAQYPPQESATMRTERNYQHSQNYRGLYDRANNGRYPLRDQEGRPMRIRHIQAQSKSLTSDAWFRNAALRPYIQWEGFENVARLYEDKLEVTTFTAAHQKAPQEASLIGERTVISRKPLPRGTALGVYGGELLPLYVAAARRDPYLIPIRNTRPTTPYAPSTQPVLSGDNALSRINTIFEYDAAEVPIRQARDGYNVEAAHFRVQTQTENEPVENVMLTALFASEDIPAGAELRWNYQYDEPTIRALFPRPGG